MRCCYCDLPYNLPTKERNWYTCTILVQLGKISAGIVEIKEVDGFTAGTAVWSEVPSGFFRLHIAPPLQDMIPRLPLAY
jgi:hypothetical protein